MKFQELAEQVMVQREKDGVRGLDRELSRLRCHILPATFAPKELADIGSPDIREWLRTMADKEAADSGEVRKLSRHTINRCQSLVSAVFTEAVERELLTTNPCSGVRAKKRVDESDTREKWAYLTPDEQKAIENCATIPIADRLAIGFAIATGLRQGEQFNLELADLVLEGKPHVVVRYGSRSKTGAKLPPKSGKRRTVPLTPTGLVVARAWLAILPTFASENPEGLVFPTRTGRRRQQGKPLGRTGTLKEHYVSAGITLRKGLHWHALRHTCATNLVTGVLGRRWTIEEVQKVMGHSSITVTQRYAHMSEDAIAKAAAETVDVSTAVVVSEPQKLGFFRNTQQRVLAVLRRLEDDDRILGRLQTAMSSLTTRRGTVNTIGSRPTSGGAPPLASKGEP
jgi:integrase